MYGRRLVDREGGWPAITGTARLVIPEDAEHGWDVFDSSKLVPLSGTFVSAAFVVEVAGRERFLVRDARPAEPGSFEVPVAVDAAGAEPAVEFSWTGLESFPAGWRFELSDHHTGATVDLRATPSYAFELEGVRGAGARAARGEASRSLLAVPAPFARFATRSDRNDAPRFSLLVVGAAVDSDGDPGQTAVFELEGPYPNPVSAVARIRFSLPHEAPVRLEALDVLGRRVSVVLDDVRPAGRHEVEWDVRGLASGVYLLRLSTPGQAETKRVTVLR